VFGVKEKCWKLWAFLLVWACLTGSALANDHDTNTRDEVFIISGKTVKVLVQTLTASGVRYEALGDQNTIFWSKGDEASLIVEGKECTKYVLVKVYSNSAPDELFLTVDGKNYWMKRVISASGEKYEAVNDSETVLWGKGASVTLTIGGVTYPDYDTWQPLGRICLHLHNMLNKRTGGNT
jgi:membrane-bound inhibitor of C-type lysozyme